MAIAYLPHLERPDADTIVQYGPLVAKHLAARMEPPEPLHGNDKRMKARKANVHDALRSVVAK